jgi:hypothetical protein
MYYEAKILRPDQNPRGLFVDAGYNQNGFSMVDSRYNQEAKTIVSDIVINLKPSKECPINFPLMYEKCILPIVTGLNVKIVVFDRWNSLFMVQDLIVKKHKSEQYTMKWNDFITVRSKINGREVVLPRIETDFDEIWNEPQGLETACYDKPVNTLYVQMATVRDHRTTVIKPAGGMDDDVWRALTLGITYVSDPEYATLFRGKNPYGKRRTTCIMSSSSNRMGMGSGIGMGGQTGMRPNVVRGPQQNGTFGNSPGQVPQMSRNNALIGLKGNRNR